MNTYATMKHLEQRFVNYTVVLHKNIGIDSRWFVYDANGQYVESIYKDGIGYYAHRGARVIVGSVFGGISIQ